MGLERTIVLGGKSAMINAIRGSQGSESEMAFGSVTQCCQKEGTVLHSRKVVVINTPVFFNMGRPKRETSAEMTKCMEFCSPDPPVFQQVILPIRFFQDLVWLIRETLILEAENSMIPLFTPKENLAEKDPEKFIREGNSALKEEASPSLQTTGLHGRKVVAVDTPGFFDAGCPERERSAEMSKRVEFCSPNPPVFRQLILSAHFYMIPLFTRKENLAEKDSEKFIREGNSALKEQASLFGNRNSAFNKKAEGREREAQVDQLMTVIDQLVEKNKESPCYMEEVIQSDQETVPTNYRRLCSLF